MASGSSCSTSRRFPNLAQPYNRVVGVTLAHQTRLIAELRTRTDIDLVHDHLEALGPSILAAAGHDVPPTLHTLHWDLTKHPELYGSFEGGGRLFVNGVSGDQLRHAPARLRAHSLGHVHLATPLADQPATPVAKDEHTVMMARICAAKGQHVAARIAHRTRIPLVLAGPVGPYRCPDTLADALRTDPAVDRHPDVAYWLDRVAGLVDGALVRWVGTVQGEQRDRLVASARATMCPLQWDKPGGTSIVESLALGTPVVGYRRGCLFELIDDDTGMFAAAGDEEGLATLLANVDRLDPGACQALARRRFTPARMAGEYLDLYDQLLNRTRTTVIDTWDRKDRAARDYPSAAAAWLATITHPGSASEDKRHWSSAADRPPGVVT